MKEHKIEAVMHFAAFAYVGVSVTDPAKYYHNNIVGSLALLDAMRDRRRRSHRVLQHLRHVRHSRSACRSPRTIRRTRSARTATPSS